MGRIKGQIHIAGTIVGVTTDCLIRRRKPMRPSAYSLK